MLDTRRRRIAVRGWLAAGAVYLTGVFHRTSLGVAGLPAAHRFGISPAQLSVFVLLQVGVYAAMQIPAGVLVDRFGPRRLLLSAAMLMAAAQLLFAVAPSYPVALLARALLGCGDALTFVSVLRFAANHFSPRRYPVIVAATTLFGYTGNLLATVPLTLVLRSAGWTPTFAGAALVSVVAALAVLILMPRTDPVHRAAANTAEVSVAGAGVRARIRAAWAAPGTRLGFWVHFSCMSAAGVFGLLWGVPYLVAQGFTKSGAGAVLFVSVLVCVAASLGIGVVISAHPAWRAPLAFAISAATVGGWTILLAAGGDHPPPLVVTVLAAVMAIGGPASSIGFSIARDYNQPSVVGTATGVVNVGGFAATIIGASTVGAVLQVAGSGPGAFRVAFATAIAIQLVGTVQMVRWWLRLRAYALHHQDRGHQMPVLVTRRPFDFSGSRASLAAAAGPPPPAGETVLSR